MTKEELEFNLKESFDFDSNRYFYHITSKENGSEIIDKGLFLEEPALDTTTIEITPDMMNGIGEFIQDEYVPHSVMQREQMVILGIPIDEIDYVIEKSDECLPYFISNKYVFGFIDLKTLELYENQEYGFCNYFVR